MAAGGCCVVGAAALLLAPLCVCARRLLTRLVAWLRVLLPGCWRRSRPGVRGGGSVLTCVFRDGLAKVKVKGTPSGRGRRSCIGKHCPTSSLGSTKQRVAQAYILVHSRLAIDRAGGSSKRQRRHRHKTQREAPTRRAAPAAVPRGRPASLALAARCPNGTLPNAAAAQLLRIISRSLARAALCCARRPSVRS